MQMRTKFAACVAWVVLVSGGFVAASGDEPKECQCPEVGVPVLSKIPYLSRLFKNVGVRHEEHCEAGGCPQTPCADQLERIGVDFELFQTCPNSPLVRFGPIELAICNEDEACCCRGKECPASCAACACPSAGMLAVSNVAIGKTAGCSGSTCCEAKCCAEKSSEAAHKTAACQCAGRDDLWEHLVELAAEKGAAEAALEAREEHSELLDALVEMATKGAALEAKLEAQTEHNKVIERMVELATENAQLKARVELAEIRTQMLKETLPVAIEKELLARRVAELEHRLAASDEDVRTAKKAAGKKPR